MVSENDNDKQKNTGRLQSSFLNVEQIKKQIEEGIKKGIEKETGNEGTLKNIAKSKPVKDLKEEILKKVEEKKSEQGHSGEKKDLLRNDLKELQRQDRLHPQESRESQVRKIREESRLEAEQAIEEASKQITDRKTKLAMKIAGKQMDAVAYAISQKMAAEANKGGIHAVIPIAMTYLISLGKDLLDFTGIGAIAGIVTGILAGTIIALFWIQTSGGWKGGYIQRKLIKKIIIKIGLAAFIETLPGPNLIPTFIIMNLWSHLDFIRSNRKAKNDHKKFVNEYKIKRKINWSIGEKYTTS